MKLRRTLEGPTAGGTLLAVLIVMVALMGLAASTFTVGLAHHEETNAVGREAKALYVAEAGIAEALVAVAAALADGNAPPATLGTPDAPLQVAGGTFDATIAADGGSAYLIRSTGRVAGSARAIEIRIATDGESAFDHAIFAGNSSGDAGYALTLGGETDQADAINGNIYSGGSIVVSGDAVVNGEVRSSGIVTDGDGADLADAMGAMTGTTRPILDLDSADYETNHDVDVAAIFDAESWNAYDAIGGDADQVPEESPAHIFRRNPTDRSTECSETAKDDYFLEDPYEKATSFKAPFGRGHEVTLSGVDGELGDSGNGLVYFIDGNLWIHNRPMGGMRFETDTEGVQLTFVIKGNLYISDDVLLDDENLDGVAFITLVDDNVEDSGNIYFGDPRWGTLELMHSYLYAENDFYDNNLDEDGSKEVVIHGNMTAGNQVAIERDYVRNDGTVEHSRLEVNFDDRVSTGSLALPGLPEPVESLEDLTMTYWMETAIQ